MAAEPIVYRVASYAPGTVTEAAELYAEQLEEIPYPLGMPEVAGGTNWPPAGFTGVTDMTTTSTNTASLLPQAYNLEWVQGDTAEFQFLFTDVNWTHVDPDEVDQPEWVETTWSSQVRNPYIYSTYASDYWVPAYGYQYNWWRGNSIVAEFDTTSELIQGFDTTDLERWATRVTLTLPATDSSLILPGNWYRWDLQTRTVDEVVKTHLRGKARIVTEWTVR
jgi:hypothetical protein